MRRPAAVVSAMLALAPIDVASQGVSAPELKAAFVLNFAKFTEWPGLPADAPIVVCIAGDDRLSVALGETVRNQSVDGHRIGVARLVDTQVRNCQLLFVASDDGHRAASLIEECGTLPVLTVSDASRFADSGGMIELFLDGGRMRFAVNVDAVQRSRVRLSSRLLGLAKIVRDHHDQ